MIVFNKKESFWVFVGDLIIFSVALWLSLFIRNGGLPIYADINNYFVPFSIIFVLWVLVFYIAGLYDKYTTVLRDRLPGMIFNAQLANSAIAVFFFYFIPIFGIAPKTILFIDLFVSFVLIYFWRVYSSHLFSLKRKESAILIGSGEEIRMLENEINNNPHANLHFVSVIDLEKVENIDFENEVVEKIYSENISIVVIDINNEKAEGILPHLYNLIFSNVVFVDFSKLYADVFDRIPLSLLKYNWFIENISLKRNNIYDFIKRTTDLFLGLFFGFFSLVLYPFVYLAIKIEDGGQVFILQERIGKGGKIIKIPKFRSMNVSDGGKWVEKDDQRITRVGKFIRKTRIDELPQLFSIIKGEMSLIGPRPDIYNLGIDLVKKIPYYSIRNIIKPGLSGWAQIKQDVVPQSFEETRDRLSYDLYYVKNRSLFLDLKIALRTIQILLSRTGK
jgi:exopolysaccharide biosynthesis polyprenyl glycosylphosphotransferase